MIRIEAGDASFAVHASGRGPMILMLHGFPFDHSMWSAQEALADVARIVAPDLRGFGKSTIGGGLESISQLADDVAGIFAAVRRENDDGAIVCGLSMGGYVAQHLAVRHPTIVRGLILVDTRLEADTESARAGRIDLAERVGRLGPRIAAEAMVPKLLAASSAGSPKRARLEADLRRMILGTRPETIRAALAALGGRPDMTDHMRSVRVPTLLVVGEEDSITPPEAMRPIIDVMPQARLIVVPGSGHMTPMEEPEAFNRAVRAFLAAD